MAQPLEAIGLGIIAFASTNLDDIFLLVAFFSDPAFSPRQVVTGQYLGIGLLVLASAAGALAALVIPPAWVGLLGLLPILIGIRRLIERGAVDPGSLELKDGSPPGFRPVISSRVLAVAAVTLANGGDNIGIYVPLFAQAPAQIPGFVVVFAVMTGAWCLVGHYLVTHRLVGEPIRRAGQLLLPYLLIGLGVFILVSADSRSLFRLPH